MNKMTRQEANYKVLEQISEVIAENPDWRFRQILQNIGVTDQSGMDRWYEESTTTLQNVIGWRRIRQK